MTNNKILFILGAGPNVATATAKHFAEQGYQVALVSRGTSTSFDPSYFYIQGDLSNPEKIPEWFAQVKKKYGGSPNVVIHNGKYAESVKFVPTGQELTSPPYSVPCLPGAPTESLIA